MHAVFLADGADLAEWRAQARALLAAAVPPDAVQWQAGAQGDLLGAGAGEGAPSPSSTGAVARVPRDFVALATLVLAHSDPRRHAVLYRLLWRITHGERALLRIATDDDVAWAERAARAVRREKHKMKAFVRFREVAGAHGPVFIAWFEPEHDVLPQVAPFFSRRFAGMRWSILTPLRSVHWDGSVLVNGPGAQRSDAPGADELENLWRTYYANIFNPARLKVGAMVREMPVRYWKNLPEAELIPGLIRRAGARMYAMVGAAPTRPRKMFPAPSVEAAAPASVGTLEALRDEVLGCRACPLWEPATQAVFGEGPADARAMVVGEQPGDQEDLHGRPFVGPAGQLFNRALAEVGIDRGTLYITNAVKHFKFTPRGKRRLHERPSAQEQAACRPWLEAELARVRPRFVLCLGATAARAVLGPGFRLMEHRGRWQPMGEGVQALATVHPSWLLRLPAGEREAAWPAFVADLAHLRDAMEQARSA
ncbi:UdgX family uracil-DNA binding protein [Novilysobacter spongiicola]|uniref:Type-4 uracil-DNA glycosylase n=1 Tax=Lysobacter spongiicola DSM 21749 TaxID=1122188 RepID=A0A1T4SEH7_9GAMM|nr:UdgX family uracil-DNA binding protein [Lysobacter spongiicola]SKA26585.1 DNA polymerase [Lysobacter spongiicola DSM 21749]